jgi:hypothetical protein
MATTVEQFRNFATAAKRLPQLQVRVPVSEFASFANRATPLAIENVSKMLPTLAKRASLITRWMTDHDLLDVAGLAYAENPYIELLAWALRRETHPPSALVRQEAWIAALKLDPPLKIEQPIVPVTQFVTGDGRPDLLLHYPDAVVVVEVKTGTNEHETPSGLSQTEAYAPSVRKTLRLPDSIHVHVVFLTPARERAVNPAAVSTSFVEFVSSVASVLEECELPAATAGAFQMLFTHLLANASPISGGVIDLIRVVAAWSSEKDWAEPQVVVRRLPELTRACHLLLPGEWNG